MACECRQITRKRPLLGRIVKIATVGVIEKCMERAITSAFTAIEQLESCLSRESADSELMQLCATIPGSYVPVTSMLRSFLLLGNDLAYHSDGLFDMAAAGTSGAAHWTDIDLSRTGHVRLRRRLSLAVGGLAKGVAADLAVQVLRDSGVGAGLVDVGGCIRAFGARPWQISFSQPCDQWNENEQTIPVLVLDGALAGFGQQFGVNRFIDIRRQMAISAEEWGASSFLVRARSCAVADALTKVVAQHPVDCPQLLRLFGAEATALPIAPLSQAEIIRKKAL